MEVLGSSPIALYTATFRIACNLFVAGQAVFREVGAMFYSAKVRLWGDFDRLSFTWLNPPALSQELCQMPPTFVLHGAFGEASDWIGFVRSIEARHLTLEKLGPIYLLNYNGLEDGVTKLHALVDKVEEQYRDLGSEVLTPRFVCHSLGGSVALKEMVVKRKWADAEFHLCASRCQVVDSVWRDGPSFLYSDMVGTLAEIRNAMPTNLPSIHTYGPSHDWLVPPEALTPYSVDHTVISGTSHLSIMSSPEVHDVLIKRLWP